MASALSNLTTLLSEEPYAAVRYIAHRSLSSLPDFEGLTYDFAGSAHQRKEVALHALERWTATMSNRLDRTGDRLLIGPTGILDRKAVEQLLKQRNNRMVELVE